MKYLFESKQILDSLSRAVSEIKCSKNSNLSRRKAIRMRCIDCSGFVLADVRDCEFPDCDLYPYRSGQGKQSPKERDQAIRKFCLYCMGGQRNEVRLCPSADCPLWEYRQTKKTLRRRKIEHIEGHSRDKLPEVISRAGGD